MGYTTEIDKLNKKIQTLELQKQQLSFALDSVNDLINNSTGVVGLHLNGEVALWSELLRGGRFEEWLGDFSDVID